MIFSVRIATSYSTVFPMVEQTTDCS